MNQAMNAFMSLAASRRAINGIYMVVPPVGLLCMYLSPSFSGRERAVRTILTASFLAFFATMGPELQLYVNAELTRLSAIN